MDTPTNDIEDSIWRRYSDQRWNWKTHEQNNGNISRWYTLSYFSHRVLVDWGRNRVIPEYPLFCTSFFPISEIEAPQHAY